MRIDPSDRVDEEWTRRMADRESVVSGVLIRADKYDSSALIAQIKHQAATNIPTRRDILRRRDPRDETFHFLFPFTREINQISLHVMRIFPNHLYNLHHAERPTVRARVSLTREIFFLFFFFPQRKAERKLQRFRLDRFIIRRLTSALRFSSKHGIIFIFARNRRDALCAEEKTRARIVTGEISSGKLHAHLYAGNNNALSNGIIADWKLSFASATFLRAVPRRRNCCIHSRLQTIRVTTRARLEIITRSANIKLINE